MGANDRTVQHLHLRAPSAQAAVHALHRLEDALRCASLPDAGERVLLVRRLHLGRLPEGLSSQSLSLLIEQRVAAVGGAWVHGDDERAAHSDTVLFASRLQAAQAAVRRRAQGDVLSAWYWPLALPGVHVLAAPVDFLAQLVTSLGALPGAPALLSALAADLWQRGHKRWLVQQVDGALAKQWVVLAHAQGFMPTLPLRRDAGTDLLPRGRTNARFNWTAQEQEQEQEQDQEQEQEQEQEQAAWLLAVLRSGARWGIGFAVTNSSGREPTEGSLRVFAQHPNPLPASRGEAGRPVVVALEPSGAEAAQPVLDEPSSTVALIDTVLYHADRDGAAATEAGGLWFLVPVLERLGFPDWQGWQPDLPLLALILRQALLCLRVPCDDPAWVWLASMPRTPGEAQHVWGEPVCWREPGVRLVHDPARPMTATNMARCWLIAARRQVRFQARMGLADLCRRPAHLVWSNTHIDVVFAGSAADVRVRRWGLDLDPGWVPWLGRVVGFVYGAPQGGRR